jgi:magnesium transporter
MLYANTGHSARRAVVPDHRVDPELEGAVWLDLLRPDDAERSAVERATGLRVPALADLSEIETSSRLATEHGALYLSSPMVYLDAEGVSRVAPIGMTLSDKHLVTVRFADMPVFDLFADRFAGGSAAPCSVAAFLGMLEAIVDRLADVLEHVGGNLDGISRRVFRPESKNSARTDVQLRAMLRAIGRAGERLSNIRDSLLGVQRIVLYTAEAASAFFPSDQKQRLKVLRQDIVSLSDYDTQLQNKVMFLLDATLGFINIEQSNGIKVLTVVSVVGVPPTLVASIYGMNFKWIPELEWGYGYFYALAVIVLSGVIPFVWFKKRGWI